MRTRFHKPCGDYLDRMNSIGKKSRVALINPCVISV